MSFCLAQAGDVLGGLFGLLIFYVYMGFCPQKIQKYALEYQAEKSSLNLHHQQYQYEH